MDQKSGRRVADVGTGGTAAEQPSLLSPTFWSGRDQHKSSEFLARLVGAEALTHAV